MTNLYIDFDGVIMNTIDVTYDDFKKTGLNIKDPNNSEAVRSFYASIDWKDLLNNRAEIINDGIECIRKIVRSNIFNVSILTHINSLNEATEKVKYIRKHLRDITIIPVPKEISKTSMVHTKDAILIDDYIGNLKEWREHKGIGIKFSTKLNGRGFPVINRLDQILDLDLTN